MAYNQFHVRVVVDSQQENASIKVIKPKRTRNSDGEEKQSSSMKIGWTRSMTGRVALAAQPQGAITLTVMKTNEKTAGSETKRYTSSIFEHHNYGVVRWGFNIDDRNAQRGGIEMLDDVLPTVDFEFIGHSDVPAPPPKHMDIVVVSHWSMILPSEPETTWIRKLLRFFRSSGNTQATSYSNLFQIVALKMVPCNLPERSDYRATLFVEPGATDADDITYSTKTTRTTASSVNVTPAVIGGRRITLLSCGPGSEHTNIFRPAEAKHFKPPNDRKV